MGKERTTDTDTQFISQRINLASLLGQLQAARRALPDTGWIHFVDAEIIERIESLDEQLRKLCQELAGKAGV